MEIYGAWICCNIDAPSSGKAPDGLDSLLLGYVVTLMLEMLDIHLMWIGWPDAQMC